MKSADSLICYVDHPINQTHFMTNDVLTDLHGNKISVVRAIPSFGYSITATSKDGSQGTFEIEGENLKRLAKLFSEAAAFKAKEI
jgi:hypothetical protein